MIVFFASMRWVECSQVSEDNTPSGYFFLCVVHMRERLTVLVIVCDVSEIFSSSAILGISKSRVVGV